VIIATGLASGGNFARRTRQSQRENLDDMKRLLTRFDVEGRRQWVGPSLRSAATCGRFDVESDGEPSESAMELIGEISRLLTRDFVTSIVTDDVYRA
jgi:hypothetical protein